jgi:signal transduction histidine kinase/ActR/RegA family two-component response regulator
LSLNIDGPERTESVLDGRLRYERALSQLSRRLLTSFHNSRKLLIEVLEILLSASNCSRVYIFENFFDEQDGVCCRQIAEICNTGVQAELKNPLLSHVPYCNGYQRWHEQFCQGLPVYGSVSDFPESERQLLQEQNILSLLVLPIFTAENLYGFIGFDDVKKQRNWNQEDIALLRTSAEMIGAWLLRQKIEADLLEREAQYREIFNTVTDALLVVDNAEKEKLELLSQLEKSKKSEALGHLLGRVAHDLSNVLSSIVGFPELLLLNLPEKDPARKPLEIMKESGTKAANITRDLLTLARRGAMKFEALDLNQIINDYLNSPEHQKLINLHPEIQIRFLPEKIPDLMGSAIHLNKMIMNLISNACEAIEKKGTVSIKTKFCSLSSGTDNHENRNTSENEKYIVLQVKDNGTGIEPDDLPHIFEPFFSRKSMGKSGTGLGMTVVSTTVEDHKGHIDVCTNPGTGTCFKIFFPPTNKKRKSSRVTKHKPFLPGKREKILIIDSSPEQRNSLKIMLSYLNYEAISASTKEEAINLFKQHIFELIIFDMGLKHGTNHLETFKLLKKEKPAQKGIAMTNTHCAEAIIRSRKADARPCLTKPFTLEALCNALQQRLNNKDT